MNGPYFLEAFSTVFEYIVLLLFIFLCDAVSTSIHASINVILTNYVIKQNCVHLQYTKPAMKLVF